MCNYRQRLYRIAGNFQGANIISKTRLQKWFSWFYSSKFSGSRHTPFAIERKPESCRYSLLFVSGSKTLSAGQRWLIGVQSQLHARGAFLPDNLYILS